MRFHNVRYLRFHVRYREILREVLRLGVIKKQIDEEAVMEFQRKKDLRFNIFGNYINIVIFLEKGGVSDMGLDSQHIGICSGYCNLLISKLILFIRRNR